MADYKLVGVETSAVSLLKQAVELDTSKRFTEALVCYREGIQLLLDVCKQTTDDSKKQNMRQRITDYMDRAEKIKGHIEKEKETGKYHEQIHIADDSMGHSYEHVFGPYLDNSVNEVIIEDPYIRNVHQIFNFLRFCELMVKVCKPTTITLVTKKDENPQSSQSNNLQEIGTSLKQNGVDLIVNFSETLHDREVKFDTGWIIKIGRGLDYFKPTANKFSIGYCDFDLRRCHETTVDVFHVKYTKS